MTFKLLLCPGSNDQIGDLRGKKASQFTHTLDLAHLIGDALFELLVLSAMGQKQTCAVQNGMSALPPIADMAAHRRVSALCQ